MKNAKTNTNAIVFAQASDSTKAVVANKYVAHTLYAQNKALVEALGGEVIKGVDGFRAEFPTVKNAKAFIAQAITSVSKSEYNKARKTEPKKVEKKATVPTPAKGAKKATKKAEENTMLIGGKLYAITESADGFVLTPVEAPKKAKGKSKAEPKKATKTEDKGFRFERVTDKKGNVTLVDTKADKPTKKGKGKADKPTPAPKSTKKAEKTTPKKSKGNCPVDFSALAGKGRAANREAAALMRKAGYVDGTSAEYKAIWAEWCKVR